MLTSSWTWCIGLFLPVLLYRLFGAAGFWAFAIPNVIGCTAFGWLAAGEHGALLRARLARPIRWFALWTIAFQLFFLARVFLDGSLVDASRMWVLVITALALVALWRDPWRGPSPQSWMWRGGLGAALGVCAWMAGAGENVTSSAVAAPPLLGENAALWAAPFIALGFLTCPLLDPTFHWVSQQTPSKVPFALFGAFFAATLALTGRMGESGEWHLPLMAGAFVIYQVVFTAVLQARCLRWMEVGGDTGQGQGQAQASRVPIALAGAIGFAVAGAVWLLPSNFAIMGVTPLPFDATYLAFLGAYSTIFPALLLFYGRRSSAIIAAAAIIAVALSVPGMYLGHTALLALAAAVVLAPRWIVRSTPR